MLVEATWRNVVEVKLELVGSTDLNKSNRYCSRADIQRTTVDNNGKAADAAFLISGLTTLVEAHRKLKYVLVQYKFAARVRYISKGAIKLNIVPIMITVISAAT